MAEIVDRVRLDVSISPVQSVNRAARDLSALVYSIGVEAAKPEAAAGVANSPAAHFVDTSLADRHRKHQLTTEFLRRELREAEQAFAEQNREIAEFKKGNRGTLPSELQANMARMDLLQNKRHSLAIQIAEAGTRIAMLAGMTVNLP